MAVNTTTPRPMSATVRKENKAHLEALQLLHPFSVEHALDSASGFDIIVNEGGKKRYTYHFMP